MTTRQFWDPQGPFHIPYPKGKTRIRKHVKSQIYMDPKSIFVIEILRFGFGFGYFINFTKELILIKEDSFV